MNLLNLNGNFNFDCSCSDVGMTPQAEAQAADPDIANSTRAIADTIGHRFNPTQRDVPKLTLSPP